MQGGEQRRVLARAAALAAQLTACIGELPTPGEESAPALERTVLSTREAAVWLGVSMYTLNEWARRGLIRARQDTPGGPRHYRLADLAAYEAGHALAIPLAESYSPPPEKPHDAGGIPRRPPHARAHGSRASKGAPRDLQHDRPVGARRTRHSPAGRNRPYAPGAHAWQPPKKPEG